MLVDYPALSKRRLVPSLAPLLTLALLACNDDTPVSGPSSAADTAPADASPDEPIPPDTTADGGDSDAAHPDLDSIDPDATDAPDEPAADTGASDGEVDDTGRSDPVSPLPLGEGVVLEIYPLDIWAQPLSDARLEIVDEDGTTTVLDDRPESQIRLTEAGRYRIRCQAPDHHDFELALEFDGRREIDAVSFESEPLADFHGLTVLRDERVNGKFIDVVDTLFLGLRHRWFAASGRPPRAGNRLELLMDGEDAWAAIRESMLGATESVHISTWWWESDAELIRPLATHATLSTEERWRNTALYSLEATPATSRVLVWQDNLVPWLTIDDAIEERGAEPDDGFEFMGMTNWTSGVFFWEITPFAFFDRVLERWEAATVGLLDPEPLIHSTVPPREVDLTDFPLGIELDVRLASWHQKFVIIDGLEAFVGGMNVRAGDWDTSKHLVFDFRRMPFDASRSERQEVMDREELPELVPRKDYMLRLQGPAVQDVQEVFQLRWDHQIEEGVDYSENATPFEVRRDIEPFPDGITVQVTTTMPDPFWEHSNVESMRNAIANAEHFILVEDQYWRAPLLTEVILERMAEDDDLVLIVISMPVSEWVDPACEWTYRTDETIRERFADRYFTYQLRTFDYVETWGWDETESRFVDINTHSKLLLVDDVFMSIGSCNKNNRGFLFEGELNLAVLDAPLVTDVRRRVLANILGVGIAEVASHADNPEDVRQMVAQLEAAAEYNRAVYDRWDDEGFDISLDGDPLPSRYRPFGFLYPLEFGDHDDCFIEGIGQDIMK